jgi:hypothetical protein
MAVARLHWSSDMRRLAYLLMVRHNSDSSVLSRQLLRRLLNLWASLRTECLWFVSLWSGAFEDKEVEAADDDSDRGGVSASEIVGVVAAVSVRPGEAGIEIISSFFDIVTG